MTVDSDMKVDGFCPMGCGNTLFLIDGGHVNGGQILCKAPSCPRPGAVHAILKDQETEHQVALGESEFSIVHPLRERLDDELIMCELHAVCTNLIGAPVRTGVYRVSPSDLPGGWSWVLLGEEDF